MTHHATQVATWNVHHRRTAKAISHDLAAVFNDGVDLIGLNEMGGHDARRMTPPHVSAYQSPAAPGSAGNAVMWRNDTYAFRKALCVKASDRTYVGPRGAGPVEMPAKYIIGAHLLHKATRRNIFALSVHMPASIEVRGRPNPDTHDRLAVCEDVWATLGRVVHKLQRHGQVLVTGDFNWDAHRDHGKWKYAPRRNASRMRLRTSYEALGLPEHATDTNRYIDYILYPANRPHIITAETQRVFDVNTDNDHRVLAVTFKLTERRTG